jgi:hypothetical protein
MEILKNNFHWIINWYNSECKGVWEHPFGVRIQTLDNPGWSVAIGIEESELKGKIFEEIRVKRSEKDWIICKVEEGSFEAYCGVNNLVEVLQIFRNWVENEVIII